jgi:hypothetical protein
MVAPRRDATRYADATQIANLSESGGRPAYNTFFRKLTGREKKNNTSQKNLL